MEKKENEDTQGQHFDKKYVRVFIGILILLSIFALVYYSYVSNFKHCESFTVDIETDFYELTAGYPVIYYTINYSNTEKINYKISAIGYNSFGLYSDSVKKDFNLNLTKNNTHFVTNWSLSYDENVYYVFPNANFFIEFSSNAKKCKEKYVYFYNINTTDIYMELFKNDTEYSA